MYYLRSKAAVDPIKFTLDNKHQRIQSDKTAEPSAEQEVMEINEGEVCVMDDGCIMCSG